MALFNDNPIFASASGGNTAGMIDFSGVTNMTDFELYDVILAGVDKVKFTNLPNLASLDLTATNSLTEIELGTLPFLTDLELDGNMFTSLDLSALSSAPITYFSCSGNPITSLDLSPLTGLTGANFSYTDITVLDLSHLTSTGANITVDHCSSLASVVMPSGDALASLHMSFSVVTSLDLTNAASLHQLSVFGDPGYLTSITFPTSSALTSLTLNNQPLTTVDISNCPSLAQFYLTAGTLTQEGVDGILATLAAGAVSAGTVDLSGGTSAAPSADGLTSKATLVGRGWTVGTN